MIGIGSTLRQAREEQGFSLKEMQRKTNIRVDYLQAIEKEQFDQLPSPFYARGFVRAYAKSLKLDFRYILDLYEGREERQQASVHSLRTKQMDRPIDKKYVSQSIPQLSDPSFRTKQLSQTRKLTMSQIETFSPRREVHTAKGKQKSIKWIAWSVTALCVFFFLLVGYWYFGYK